MTLHSGEHRHGRCLEKRRKADLDILFHQVQAPRNICGTQKPQERFFFF